MNWWTFVRLVVRAVSFMIRLAHLRRSRMDRPEHDTVSCSDVYILPGMLMCTSLERSELLSEEQRLVIAGFLRVFGCTCPAGDWSSFGSVDPDSLYAERSCRVCGMTASLYWERPSTTRSSQKEHS